MTTAEPRRAGATLAALNSGSGLHKLVKMGSAASSYAPSDVEVAHIEAQFTGPDLHESAKELLQSSASEEVERRALLDRMQEFDMVMDRVDAHGSAKMDGGLSDVHTASTHGLSFDSAQVRPFPPARPIRHQPRCAERTTERATRALWFFFSPPSPPPARAPRARSGFDPPRSRRARIATTDPDPDPAVHQGASIGFDVLDSAAGKSIAPVIHRGAPDHHHLQTRCPYDGLAGARSRVVAPEWRYYFAAAQSASLENVLSAPP